MARFVLASGNDHKLREFRAILAPHEVTAMPPGVTLPPEGVESFAANASLVAPADGLVFIADDSGLEVEALGWAPGIVSARYAGIDGPGADKANVARLLGALAGFAGAPARRARFVCALVAVTPGMEEYEATGYWWGAIVEAPRGEGGFGYDPVFIPEGSDLTVAQWPQEQKDQASHRALAGTALLERLRQEGLLDEPDRERRPQAG